MDISFQVKSRFDVDAALMQVLDDSFILEFEILVKSTLPDSGAGFLPRETTVQRVGVSSFLIGLNNKGAVRNALNPEPLRESFNSWRGEKLREALRGDL